MDLIEMRSELSHILSKLKSAQRSSDRHDMPFRGKLSILVEEVERDLGEVKKCIEDEKSS